MDPSFQIKRPARALHEARVMVAELAGMVTVKVADADVLDLLGRDLEHLQAIDI